ncbi:MAG: hypothetical protein PHC85_02900 [Candidatus Pacebacteria bacterium]|nr:hypothetical protein [Candidatus Paceibacterota bacterium]
MDWIKEWEVEEFIGWCFAGTSATWASVIVEGHHASVAFNGLYVILHEEEIGLSRFSPEDFYDRFFGKIQKPIISSSEEMKSHKIRYWCQAALTE